MRLKTIISCTIALILIIVFLYYENNSISITRIALSFKKLPKGFNRYKIVQLSDLHEKEFGKNNIKLISKVKTEKPDVIFITGDLINATAHNDYNEKAVLTLVKQLSTITSVYFVTGNHEVSTINFKLLENKLSAAGVTVLRNRSVKITRGMDNLLLIGVDDPEYASKAFVPQNTKVIIGELDKAIPKGTENSFKILLSHRPEQFELYAKYNIDLIFTGHAHGGQVRLPYLGELYVPNQGFFPRYTAGSYSLGCSTMIVSRGLGNSRMTFRLFNKPEILVTTLYTY